MRTKPHRGLLHGDDVIITYERLFVNTHLSPCFRGYESRRALCIGAKVCYIDTSLPMLSNEDKAPARVEFTIRTATIFKIVGVFALFWFLYFVRDVIAVFFVALVLSSIIDPFADWLEVRRIPRAIAVLIVYVVLFSIVGLVIGVLIPPLIQEIRDLLQFQARHNILEDRLYRDCAVDRLSQC